MDTTQIKTAKRDRRHKRIRAKIFGTSARPRLSVFKSSKHFYGQLIDDENGVTLASVSSLIKKEAKKTTLSPRDLGGMLAEEAKGKKITEVVFDRGGFIYIGRVKAFAEGAREGGLVF